MKGYKTSLYADTIDEIEITKLTEKFYVVNGRRISKNSTYEFIGESKEEVKEKCAHHINNEIDNLEGQIAYQKTKLAKIQSL
jgi:hypothetical protein